MESIDEHLQRLAEEGSAESEGQFTVASEQVWSRLEKSLSSGQEFGNCLTRWLVSRGAREIRVSENASQGTLTFRALLDSEEQEWRQMDEALNRGFDYSGQDLDLARAIVSAALLKFKSLSLTFPFEGTEYSCDLLNREAPAEQGTSVESHMSVSLRRSSFSLRQFKDQRKSLQRNFCHSPIPVIWGQSCLSRPLEALADACVWRHLTPRNEVSFPKLAVSPPKACLEFFRTERHPNSEIYMGLSRQKQTAIYAIHHGHCFAIERPGFLAGFVIVLQSEDTRLDMTGTAIVRDLKLQDLLDSLKSEAYDMMLQLFNIRTGLEPKVISDNFCALESVLLNLVEDKRFAEGYVLVKWLEDAWSRIVVGNSSLDCFTFAEMCRLFASRANHPKTSLRWAERAKAIEGEMVKTSPEFRVQALLTRSRLDVRSRRGESPLMGHDSERALHLGAIRCQREGDHLNASRLFDTLSSAFAEDQGDHWTHKANSAESALLAGDIPRAKQTFSEISQWYDSRGKKLPRSIATQLTKLSE